MDGPLGIPDKKSDNVENFPSTDTLCFLFARKSQITFKIFPLGLFHS